MKKQVIIFLLLTSLFSQTFRDLTERPIYSPQKIANPITLDGSLSENEWQVAQVATNFVGTGLFQGIDSPLNTEARVIYDDKYLYIGFKAFVDKSELRYSLTKRDNLDGTDDRVWINIDTFDDESLTYGIGVSAANVQIDGRDGFGFDQSLDLTYETSVKIYEDRYEVEMAIPFSSLRYSVTEVQTWRINFGRGFTGNDELTRYVYWASKIDGIECRTCQLGFLKDFNPAKQEKGDIEYIPSIVATHSDNFLNNTSSSTDEASIFVKYPISSVDLLEVALNPDFSQIESDDIATNVNTVNALYFPERRPFFSQGAELFKFNPNRGYINLFYSRTINDPSIVGKYTGKIGKTSYGVISARDESSPLLLPFEESSTIVDMGKSISNIIRVKRMIANGGSIGGIITNRKFDGAGDMTTGGIDFHYHPGLNIHLTLHATASVHNESDNGEYQPEEDDIPLSADNTFTTAFDGEKVSGNALGFSLSRFNRTDSSGLTVRLRSPGFRTSNGFEKNNATKWLKMSKGKSIYYKNSPKLLKSEHSLQIIHKENYEGLVKRQEVTLENKFSFNNSFDFGIETEIQNENFRGVQFDGHTDTSIYFSGNVNSKLRVSAGINFNDEIIRYVAIPVVTWERSIGGEVDYKISDKSNISFGLEYEEAKEYYDGYTMKLIGNHAFNSKLTLRSKIQYNGFADTWFIEPLITYQPTAFSALYFGINDKLVIDDGSIFSNFTEVERQLFIKFQYLF